MHTRRINQICGHLSTFTSAPTRTSGVSGKCSSELWGFTPKGERVELYTLVNRRGLIAKISTYGATLTEMHVPDKRGVVEDITHGFSTLEAYQRSSPYFGCTVGRYANRIAKGKFTLKGKTYLLATNNGPNHLHGGIVGFDKRVWTAQEQFTNPEGPSVVFFLRSADGDEGYPGNMDIKVVYTLTHEDELRIDYTASTDAPTIVNLTNHAYWNLGGQRSDSILDHELQICAKHFTPMDDTSVTVGTLQPVEGTPMDFTSFHTIGERIDKVPGAAPGGYDHNWVLKQQAGPLSLAARVYHPPTGRAMDVLTTEPGVQLYTGNYLGGSGEPTGKGGYPYKFRSAFCLETQNYPNAVNHPHFPSPVLNPGSVYRHTTVHRFSTR